MTRTKPVVAAFDFDGTITARDTFVPYLDRAFGWRRVRLTLVSLSADAVQVVLAISDRDRFKARVLGRLFAGQSVPTLRQIGEEHARALEARLRPAALERIGWHRARGHRLIMVSASLDLYLEPLAARLGFNDLLCTKLANDGIRFDGGMFGANCRGPEKVRQLENLLGDLTDYELYAYGDSAGDREMLERADYPFYRPFTRSSRDVDA